MISRCPPYPTHLGDRLIIYHLARELLRRGVALDLLAFANRPEDWAIDWSEANPGFRQIELIAEPPRTQGAYLQRALWPGRRFPQTAEAAWSADMWQAIVRLRKENHYDVAHLFGGIQVYEYYQALAGLPSMITPYESYSLYLRRQAAQQPFKLSIRLQQLMARQFERWMFAPYQRVVVVAERDKAELQTINPALPVEVIPNGIDLDYFTPARGERETVALIFTGNFEYAPNVDAALRLCQDILPHIQAQLPQTQVWLVGNNPPPELQALAGDRITVTGHVPDMRFYLARATVFVSPLRLGAGIKNKVLEALAMALPVVATPLSVDGIHVRHDESALLAESDEQLAAAVVRLLQDAPLRARLAAQGRALIEATYQWGAVASAYEALYSALGT